MPVGETRAISLIVSPVLGPEVTTYDDCQTPVADWVCTGGGVGVLLPPPPPHAVAMTTALRSDANVLNIIRIDSPRLVVALCRAEASPAFWEMSTMSRHFGHTVAFDPGDPSSPSGNHRRIP